MNEWDKQSSDKGAHAMGLEVNTCQSVVEHIPTGCGSSLSRNLVKITSIVVILKYVIPW